MNAGLNYIIESNAALILFLLLYLLLLGREHDFRIKRFVLLTGILASLVFPIFHFESSVAIPTIGNSVPSAWVPETGDEEIIQVENNIDYWFFIGCIYKAGVIFFSLLLVTRVISLIRKFSNYPFYKKGPLQITESAEPTPSFSFFNYIVIGRANEITGYEKQQIIRHESVHAQQLHSFDILMISMLQVFFWFNPILIIYRKLFVQLHEFEADARTAEDEDVNKYCSLLAKEALQTANLQLGNHFNSSLTLKRIAMLKTTKTKLNRWKLMMIIPAMTSLFFLVSCQEQLIAQESFQGAYTKVDEPALPEV